MTSGARSVALRCMAAMKAAVHAASGAAPSRLLTEVPARTQSVSVDQLFHICTECIQASRSLSGEASSRKRAVTGVLRKAPPFLLNKPSAARAFRSMPVARGSLLSFAATSSAVAPSPIAVKTLTTNQTGHIIGKHTFTVTEPGQPPIHRTPACAGRRRRPSLFLAKPPRRKAFMHICSAPLRLGAESAVPFARESYPRRRKEKAPANRGLCNKLAIDGRPRSTASCRTA